ncbi:iron ABC transporter permease [Rossellomorea marisflavi]|nr:iron ABC transporter permease [Rossellomorea marisflavi]MCM2605120.1 iron ABC transporter permease [Rossellomorea marisflavi]QHA37472.1 iron chelate uptake ABC transporter family permease subunit [Rossellomorea marisflavi]TYO69736.1 iron ABC transporter permease [Rossellomorea marisflavi]USK91326.1 iron ABC transporter permease [Rossellomorea marisflavi]
MMKPKNQLLLFAGTVVVLIAFIALSIVYGYTDTSWKAAFDTFMEPDGSTEHLVIQNIRLPRALIAAAVGASLAISGVLMQTLTKNPLASPGIFGINAGGGFMVVMAVTLFGVTSLQSFAWLSFLGAAIAAVGVFIIGGASGSNGLTPMKLTLAGAAITAMFSSFTQGLLVLNEAALEQVLFWLAGSVQGRSLEILAGVFPYILAGWILALMIAGKMNILAMGEDVAKGLGVKTNILKVISLVAVVLLAGGSVAVAGPIGFIGIVIPHIARKMIGVDHRWLIPYSGLLGAILLLAADIGARYIIMPQEVPVGVMTAVIGAPFFVYVARRGY